MKKFNVFYGYFIYALLMCLQFSERYVTDYHYEHCPEDNIEAEIKAELKLLLHQTILYIVLLPVVVLLAICFGNAFPHILILLLVLIPPIAASLIFAGKLTR